MAMDVSVLIKVSTVEIAEAMSIWPISQVREFARELVLHIEAEAGASAASAFADAAHLTAKAELDASDE